MSEKDIGKAVQQICRAADEIQDPLRRPPNTPHPNRSPSPEDDVSERALSHPEVRRFQEMFPDAQVRTVRNLKE